MRHQTEITKKDRYSSSNKKVNFFEETQGEVFINEDLCQVYRVDIEPVKPTFTGGFIAEMRKLQKALIAGQKGGISRFLERYGTHYMVQSWLGNI